MTNDVTVSDDSEYEIPAAEIYVRANLSEDGICWSCQTLISSSALPLSLDSDTLLPVCLACWGEQTVAERLGLRFSSGIRCDPPGTWFNACPLCHNKRCPHCEDHRYGCTASNAPGQVGTLDTKGGE